MAELRPGELSRTPERCGAPASRGLPGASARLRGTQPRQAACPLAVPLYRQAAAAYDDRKNAGRQVHGQQHAAAKPASNNWRSASAFPLRPVTTGLVP